jgi:hypothetical protein
MGGLGHRPSARRRAPERRQHLLKLPSTPGATVDLYLKDESTHPTGGLKHRLARSLFLYAICNGDVGPDTPVVEASSGSTAISEAYFTRLVGLSFVAVVARSTSPEKVAMIERESGRCEFVDSPGEVYEAARRIAERTGGHYLDQFTNAERATDWRGNNNVAESIFEQLAEEPHPVPEWIVVGAGTGGPPPAPVNGQDPRVWSEQFQAMVLFRDRDVGRRREGDEGAGLGPGYHQHLQRYRGSYAGSGVLEHAAVQSRRVEQDPGHLRWLETESRATSWCPAVSGRRASPSWMRPRPLARGGASRRSPSSA